MVEMKIFEPTSVIYFTMEKAACESDMLQYNFDSAVHILVYFGVLDTTFQNGDSKIQGKK